MVSHRGIKANPTKVYTIHRMNCHTRFPEGNRCISYVCQDLVPHI
jgi:hypothetical protein